MDDVVKEVLRIVMPAGDGIGAADVAIIEAAVKCAVDVTHEAGTFEGTVDAALNSLRSAVRLLDGV
jgi:hypothetical protein